MKKRMDKTYKNGNVLSSQCRIAWQEKQGYNVNVS